VKINMANINKVLITATLILMLATNVMAATPKVILAFDDGWTSQYYKAFPIMQANHQNGTAFIITGEVAGASGQPGMEYMNLSQLKALYNAGWDLSSHTVTHPDLTTLNSTALDSELSTSKNWLNNSGFIKASGFLAYPYGAYDTTVISALQANGYLAARTVNPDPSYPQFTLSSPSIYELPTLIVQGVPGYGDPSTPPAYIKNEINNTIASNGLLIITFHIIEDVCCVAGANAPEEYKTSDFKIISDFLKSKVDVGQLDVVTMSEYFGTSIPAPTPTPTPQVTNLSANPAIILNDNGRARSPGTNVTRLNVTVTGNISSVTIDLSPLGGSATAPMTRILGTDNYTITTNATAGMNLTNNLVVNATDTNGNFNNSVSIPLTVSLRGDFNGDGKIDLKDLLFLRRHLAGLEPSINPLVADIQPAEGDGNVDLKDLLFMRKYLAGLEPLI
jgi:peptidoglycan/xylan/chitin deacetylase (PgdA/CDA1 family)